MRTPRSATSTTAWLVSLAIVALVALTGQGTAHAVSSPGLSNQASPSGFPVGSPIYDSATLGGGSNPTGYLTFNLFAPTNPTCAGAAIYTSHVSVVGNGYYESGRYLTSAAGTYRWTAAYSGDANNNPAGPTACSDPAGQVILGKKVPVLSASPTWAPPSATDTAVLSSGAGPAGPTGVMTYTLFGPYNMVCAGAPVFTTTRTVTGNGTYTSAPFNPSGSGTFQWIVSYSGDANNFARSTTCSETSNSFNTSSGNSATTVSATPTTVGKGATITATWAGISSPTSTDWLAIYKAGVADGGPVMTWKYTTGTASGSVTLKFPWGAAAGTYEVRLMANNTIVRLATSEPITMIW